MMFADIEKARREMDVTARVLCARAGVDPAAYSQFRRGRRDPRESTLRKLAQAVDRLKAERQEAGDAGSAA